MWKKLNIYHLQSESSLGLMFIEQIGVANEWAVNS